MKIIIIKLGALGDVVRTLCVLPAIREKYPQSEITWITKQNAVQLFEGNPYVNQVFSLPFNSSKEKYDILYNFDTEEEATKLAEEINAEEKLGFYSQDGFPMPFNPQAQYYLDTMFDDELKKTNKKTYQEIMFNLADLKWKKQPYKIYLNKKDLQYAEDFKQQNNLKTNNLLGIHMGAGSRWPSKAWHPENLKEFIIKAKLKGFEIILFGGPNETEKIKEFSDNLKKQNIILYLNNPKNTIKEFASLVNLCKIMVCSDSFALHISLALEKPTIGLFFCTSPDEVEDYGLLKKIISPKLYDFFPEKSDQYSEELTKSIPAEKIIKVLESIK